MYVVIFRAKASKQDNQYSETVNELRRLAFDTYGCIEFVAMNDGCDELTLSYWQDEDAIKKWKQDTSHLLAQQQGRNKWYQNYSVEVAHITRSYQFTAKD